MGASGALATGAFAALARKGMSLTCGHSHSSDTPSPRPSAAVAASSATKGIRRRAIGGPAAAISSCSGRASNALFSRSSRRKALRIVLIPRLALRWLPAAR